MPVVIGGKAGGAVERLRAFGDEPHLVQDRHEIDVGEGELIIDQIGGPGDRLVKNPDLRAQRRRNGLDRLVGQACRRRSLGRHRREDRCG
jgi:hypothetical protein